MASARQRGTTWTGYWRDGGKQKTQGASPRRSQPWIALNANGIPSKRGGKWHPQTVARVLGRDVAAVQQTA